MSESLPTNNKRDPFVLLPENRLAYTALKQVSERTGAGNRPLVYLAGSAGCGKTHLVRHAVRQLKGNYQVVSLTAVELAEGFDQALEQKRIEEHEKTLRKADVFICEDIHSLADQEKAQRYLIGLVDDLRAMGRFVVLTGKAAPAELGLITKLVNRLQGGVFVQIDPPKQASRVKLLEQFALRRSLPLAPEACALLAERLSVSPRELQAAVVQLDVLSQQLRAKPDVTLAERYLRHDFKQPDLNLNKITRAVATEFRVSVNALRSNTREHSVVLPRQVAMYLARKQIGLHYVEIGSYFGGRNHSTVVHSCNRISKLLNSDTTLAWQVDQIRARLRVPQSVS